MTVPVGSSADPVSQRRPGLRAQSALAEAMRVGKFDPLGLSIYTKNGILREHHRLDRAAWMLREFVAVNTKDAAGASKVKFARKG